MFNKQKQNAKKVYKYLEKRFFSFEIISPRIRELLKNDKVLKELNKMLPEDLQLFRKEDLYIGRIGIITNKKDEAIDLGNIKTNIKYQHYCYAVLRKFNDEEFEKYAYNKSYCRDFSSVYNWLSKNLFIEKKDHYYETRKGDLFLGQMIPAGLYFTNDLITFDLITLERIKECEKKLNKEKTKNKFEK